jgi:hypothetical protein
MVEKIRQSSSRTDALASPCYFDASLLFRCMDMLQIDRSKLMRDEPLLYRELQGVCTLCPNKKDCSFDLARGFDGIAWDEWWLHCPNSAMLTTIGALQKCGQSPRHVTASAAKNAATSMIVAAVIGKRPKNQDRSRAPCIAAAPRRAASTRGRVKR